MNQIPHIVLTESGIPKAFWNVDGSKARLRTKHKREVLKWLYHEDRKTVLRISGETQSGKTSLACCLLMMFYLKTEEANSQTIRYVTLPDLVQSFFNRDSAEIPYFRFETCELLVIDELAGRENAGHSQILEQILKKRMDNKKPTILCESVYDGAGQLDKDYGGEIARRVMIASLSVTLDTSTDAY
jgi:DNA replication protein DnaC